MSEDSNKVMFTTRIKPDSVDKIHELSRESGKPMAIILEELIDKKHYEAMRAQMNFLDDGYLDKKT